MSKSSRQNVHHSRGAILDAAGDLYSKLGYERVSLEPSHKYLRRMTAQASCTIPRKFYA
jgi:hypothetical protein